MWIKWFPWRYILSRVSQARGFLDPIAVLNAAHRFAQPSEVAVPTELLRSGVVMHARGLINTQAIQHNLDWIWPYWVERQFNPDDVAFIPRAFSATHINLTHRNWSAVGLPGLEVTPLVDPRGLVTPFHDSWSLDFWIISDVGPNLIPSKIESISQQLSLRDNLSINTTARLEGINLLSSIEAIQNANCYDCQISLEGNTQTPAKLIVTLRPYNPEGISFIHEISFDPSTATCIVNKDHKIIFSEPPEDFRMSTYHEGDIYYTLTSSQFNNKATCNVGLATAAAIFNLKPNISRNIKINIPIHNLQKTRQPSGNSSTSWKDSLATSASLSMESNPHFQFLYDSALRTLILLTPHNDIYPGSFTYKRFWFRDAAFMLHALLCAGLNKLVCTVLDSFPSRQRTDGYFLSQEGEWDSNGEALWIFARYCELTGEKPKETWINSIICGAEWIINKRAKNKNSRLSGLLPAGFSAEHFGPSDFYYWDNFWGIAGLQSAALLLKLSGDTLREQKYLNEANLYMQDVVHSTSLVSNCIKPPAIPVGPNRRMDSAAVGNLVASYPLQLFPPKNPHIAATYEYLLRNCVHHGGFFQEMTHSGVNAYLTLHLAQALLRDGDYRFSQLIKDISELASPTGHWPEAIHPQTKGGCMGDGQHGWAAAEWIVMMRNLFVREEGESLILCSGLTKNLLKDGSNISFANAPTKWGLISIQVRCTLKETNISLAYKWQHTKPVLEIRLPEHNSILLKDDQTSITLPY